MKYDKYPIQSIQELLDGMEGLLVSSKLDMFAGYWQVRLADHIQEPSISRCKYRSHQIQIRPFGRMNSPATFQMMAGALFRDLPIVKVYTDAVVVGSKTVQEHIEHLISVCERIQTEA